MKLTSQKASFFTEQLLHWHEYENDRSLPWKEEQDPYKIWLSEIILQQTRAAQGLPYYLKFIEHYPTVNDLAAANDDQVFRLWQGLGYYNRCKNMLAAARCIVKELDGVFPNTYEGLLALKGVGSYTAAAIGSFAYGLPNAVVDGNVYRVLARFCAIDTPIDTTEGKKVFEHLANRLLDKKDSAAYNQAIMDMGATVCMPKKPDCSICPVSEKCAARKLGLISVLPVKAKKLQVRERFFYYILFEREDNVWIRKRGAGDIWENLFEPYLIEADKQLDRKALEKEVSSVTANTLHYEGSLKQRLTHQLIEFQFYTCKVNNNKQIDDRGFWVKKGHLSGYSFPKTLVSFFEKKLYF